MSKNTIIVSRYIIALVWLVNGLFCKVLNLVPRHQQIVAEILGSEYAPFLTKMIGVSEICMAIWIISQIRPRLNAIAQISIVIVMNILEFVLVPNRLLWGKFNAIFALLFVLFVYFHEFVWKPKQAA